jgi:hypothetical protein
MNTNPSIILDLIVDLFKLCLPVDYPHLIAFRVKYGFRSSIPKKLLVIEFLRTSDPWNEALGLDSKFNKLSLPNYLVNSLIKTNAWSVLVQDQSIFVDESNLELTYKILDNYWRALKYSSTLNLEQDTNLDHPLHPLHHCTVRSFSSSEYLDFLNYLKHVEVNPNNNYKEFTTIVSLIAEFNLRSESAIGQKYIQLANNFKEGLHSLEDAALVKELLEVQDDEAFLQAI